MIYNIELKHWTDLLIQEFTFPGWVFRGHSDHNWTLATTIERNDLKSREIGALHNREKWILRDFERKAHTFINQPPHHDAPLEWLSLLQHHGGPTRLLDFTKSIFVALFFACENANDDAIIWMLDYHRLLNAHAKRGREETIGDQQRKILNSARDIIGNKSEKGGILPIEPERLSARMSIQQSISLMPIDINMSFMDNLKREYKWNSLDRRAVGLEEFRLKHYSKDADVSVIGIKKEWVNPIIHKLNEMNINANTLFPGLDGFARSLRIHCRMPY